jgi:hypothetical protein
MNSISLNLVPEASGRAPSQKLVEGVFTLYPSLAITDFKSISYKISLIFINSLNNNFI